MKRAVHLVRDYAFPPDAVWHALTDRALLASWLMENDFAPQLGHRFTLRTDPAPGFDGIVHAEVLELEPPSQMRWRWRGGPVDTIVTFRLEPRIVFAQSGTRLHLDHEGFDGLPAVLVSMILGAGWSRMLRGRLAAVIARGELASPPPDDSARALWYWLSRLFAPLLRRRGG